MLTDEDGHTAGEKRLGEPWSERCVPAADGAKHRVRHPILVLGAIKLLAHEARRVAAKLPEELLSAPAEAVPTGVK